MFLPPNTDQSGDAILLELRSLVARGRHVEADRTAQARTRRIGQGHRRAFTALRAEISLGLGRFAAALDWAAETLKGLQSSDRLIPLAEGSRIRALLGLGRFKEADAAVESNFAALHTDGIDLRLFRAQVALRSGRLVEAASAADAACARAIEAKKREKYLEALQLHARVARESGDSPGARRDLDRAARLSNGLRDTGAFAAVLSDRADLMAHTGEWTDAAKAAGQSGRLFARAFSPHEHLSAGRRTGLLGLAQGDPHAAMPSIERAAAVARRGFGTSECRAEIDLMLADAQLAGRNPEGALERASAALASFRHAQDPGGLARAHVRRSLAALSASNPGLALREARIAASIKDAGPIAQGLADIALGRILMRKERSAASAAFDRASRNPSLYPPLLSVAHLGIALANGASVQSDAVTLNLGRIESFGDVRILALVRSDLKEMFGVDPFGATKVERPMEIVREDDGPDDEEFLPGLVGRSEPVRRLAALVRRFAPHDVSVSIYGATGTGKENVARAIHDLSDRSEKKFVPVNAAGLTDELFESTMFGHKKGAFTGALSDQVGLVEEANGGTLFIDEMADLTPRNQVRLLRFLQEGTYRKLGDSREKAANVRIVVAANQRLEDLVQKGVFRDDLRHRIEGVSVIVPSLAERGRDVVRLARHFVATFSRNAKRLSLDAEVEIQVHSWPGNVRELQKAMQRAVVLSDASSIDWERPKAIAASNSIASTQVAPGGTLLQVVAEFERTFVKTALASGSERAEVARLLGISRQSLHQKVIRYGL
ncbi:MAG: sigma 54-interacting transcriptional regulator [Vicinamibacteria bacterium]